jgi:hypothetical protein
MNAFPPPAAAGVPARLRAKLQAEFRQCQAAPAVRLAYNVWF